MTVFVTALYAVILVWAAWRYLRTRDPLLRDVMWIFAAVALTFVLAVYGALVGPPPRVLKSVVVLLLIAQPLLTLRLVGRVRPVPHWMMVGAFAAWLASAGPVVVFTDPWPSPARLLVVVMFFTGEAAAAWMFGLEALRRGGAARNRLWCAAGGTAMFGAAMSVIISGRAAGVDGRALAVVSASLYMLAFVPPRWLRRMWSQNAAYAVVSQLLAAPADEPPAKTWQCYCTCTAQVLGADAVVVLMPDPDDGVRPVGQHGLPEAGRRCSRHDLKDLLAREGTIDALAGWTRPPAAAVVFAHASDTRYVTVAPVRTPDGRGALLLLNRYRSLFADDDVAFFTELAGRAAALAGRARALAERERLAVIVESSHDAIIGKTLDGVITSWNTGAERLYGYRREEVIGRHASMLFPPDQREAEADLMARIARGERISRHRLRRRRKDGRTVTISLTLSPITGPNGEVIGLASISRDIGERQRVEAMFEGLLEAAPDAIVGVTEDGTITVINAQAERMFGYERDELLGQSVDILVPARYRVAYRQYRTAFAAAPGARNVTARDTLTAVRRDGSEFPAEISRSLVKTDHGTVITTAIRDVTDRLAAQAERERLIAQAERDAAERRLQHTRRLESLGQLAGGVAHDFNNILAVITNTAELLAATLESPDPSPDDLTDARNDVAQISRAAERAAQLTKQLLAFGRRDVTKAEVLSLNHVIGDVEQTLRRTLGDHIHLMTNLDRALWPVYADSGQIEQILINLAVNARDAMPGGGTLSLDTTNADLGPDDVAGTPLTPGRHVRLRVSDTGTGMPPEVLERAFEPFFTTKPKGSGTGLGLATVYGVATAAGGDVRLYSEAGIGTTVTVVLPAVQTPADATGDATVPPAATEPPATGESRPDETILLVEDEEALRQVTARILIRAGYDVLTAAGGAQAIHIARTHPGRVHLLLTDVIMPGMTGNEVAAHIREILPDTPVLYMSGYAEPILTENGTLQAGIVLVEKPFTSAELLARVRAVLHRSETRTRR